jgi:hypothetical protein
MLDPALSSKTNKDFGWADESSSNQTDHLIFDPERWLLEACLNAAAKGFGFRMQNLSSELL